MDTNLIERLARLRGIGDAYHDYRGELRYFTLRDQDRHSARHGLRGGRSRRARGRGEPTRRRARPGAVADDRRESVRARGVDINITARDFGARLLWAVNLESGERRTGRRVHRRLRGDLARRRSKARGSPAGASSCRSTCRRDDMSSRSRSAPARSAAVRWFSRRPTATSPRPSAVAGGCGASPFSSTPYARGATGASGISSDLKALIRWLAPRGAGFIGLNPLHALAPAEPGRASPYSASSRHFLNILYIAVTTVPELEQCAAAQARMQEPSFVDRLRELRDGRLVDYMGVAQIKFEILRLLFVEFQLRHLSPGSARAAAFRSFVAAGGQLLQLHARFDALDQYLRSTQGTPSGWLSWPPEFHDPHSSAARAFRCRASSRDRVLLVSSMAGARPARRRAGAGARARHAHRSVWRLRGGHPPLGLGDLGRSDRLPPRRRDRRAPRSAGTSRSRVGNSAARIRWSWSRSICKDSCACFATTCTTTALYGWIT